MVFDPHTPIKYVPQFSCMSLLIVGPAGGDFYFGRDWLPKEVSLYSPGLNWATLYRGLVQGHSEHINVGFGEVLDLREVFKGEEEAVALLVY